MMSMAEKCNDLLELNDRLTAELAATKAALEQANKRCAEHLSRASQSAFYEGAYWLRSKYNISDKDMDMAREVAYERYGLGADHA